MRKIDIEIMKNIRNEFMKDYDEKDFQYLGNYFSVDFADYAFSELDRNSDIDKDMLESPSLENLSILDGEYGVIEGQYEEEFILKRNKGKIPLGLNIKQLNALDFGYYTWIEYGYFDEDGFTYYDIECVNGVDSLFELPYFKRIFTLLDNYLAKAGLIKDSKVTTDDIEVICDFNEYFMKKINEYGCMVKATNFLLEK